MFRILFQIRICCLAGLLLLVPACSDGNWKDRIFVKNRETYRINMYYEGVGRTASVSTPASILFTRWNKGRQPLKRFDIDTGTVCQISDPELYIHDFGYCAEKNMIAFSASPELYDVTADLFLLDPEASSPRRLTDGIGFCFAPSFSPDGQRIAFGVQADTTNGQADLYVLDLAENKLTQLTAGENYDGFPFWTADNGHIVFFRATRYGHNSPIAASHWHCWRPYLLEVPGGEPVPFEAGGMYRLYWPALSPDGSMLVYASGDDSVDDLSFFSLKSEQPGSADVPDENGLIIERRALPESWNKPVLFPVFSPDSGSMAFASYEVEKGEDEYHSDLYLLNLKENQARQLTQLRKHIVSPVFSGDGRRILFFVNPRIPSRPDDRQLWTVEIETGRVYQLLENT